MRRGLPHLLLYDEHMSSGIIRRLGVERAATLTRIAELTRSFDDVVASIEGVGNDDEHDPEGATIAFERAQVRALLDTARSELRSIDDALGRFEQGSYGRCAECVQPISRDRLDALPTTTTCVSCASS